MLKFGAKDQLELDSFRSQVALESQLWAPAELTWLKYT